MNTENNVYGQCRHGENMTTCIHCKSKEEAKIEFIKNDPRYSYLLEHKSNYGFWLDDNYLLTNDPLKAMVFNGDEGRAKAKIFLAINQSKKTLMDFKVAEHEFVHKTTTR